MTIDISHFKFLNNTWQCMFSLPRSMTVWIKGGKDFFDEVDNVKELELLVRTIDDYVEQAISFVRNSEYASDVTNFSELEFDSVYVSDWTDLRLWFYLGSDTDRMLGVRLKDSETVDVYCDH